MPVNPVYALKRIGHGFAHVWTEINFCRARCPFAVRAGQAVPLARVASVSQGYTS
jgi:hypothetical protein